MERKQTHTHRSQIGKVNDNVSGNHCVVLWTKQNEMKNKITKNKQTKQISKPAMHIVFAAIFDDELMGTQKLCGGGGGRRWDWCNGKRVSMPHWSRPAIEHTFSFWFWGADRSESGSVLHREKKIWIGKYTHRNEWINKRNSTVLDNARFTHNSPCTVYIVTQHLTPFRKIYHKQNYWWSFNRKRSRKNVKDGEEKWNVSNDWVGLRERETKSQIHD